MPKLIYNYENDKKKKEGEDYEKNRIYFYDCMLLVTNISFAEEIDYASYAENYIK